MLCTKKRDRLSAAGRQRRAPLRMPTLHARGSLATATPTATANLRIKILDFRGFDSSRLLILLKGWNSHVHREFPAKFESTSLCRDNHSKEIGRTSCLMRSLGRAAFRNGASRAVCNSAGRCSSRETRRSLARARSASRLGDSCSEGGMIRLETLIESSSSSFSI